MSTMDKERKLGITYILIGILVPLLALPFISGFSKEKSFYDNFFDTGIELSKDESQSIISSNKNIEKEKDNTFKFSRLIPQKIPFRIFLAVMVIFLYLGIIKIDSWRRNRNSQQNKEVN